MDADKQEGAENESKPQYGGDNYERPAAEDGKQPLSRNGTVIFRAED